jgi:hypothetical protein|tara:strand:+ start:236 stop:958 length:723 start_codon:yes stop_codon:yes gene_type:complete
MASDWMRSEIMGEFEDFMVAICVDEVNGNYEMRFGFFNPDVDEYVDRAGRIFKNIGLRPIRSKSIYLFIYESNDYIIDKSVDFANLVISRKGRVGGSLDEEMYELFKAYEKVKNSLKIWVPRLKEFDGYLSNFGMEDLINGEKDILVYDQYSNFALAVMEKKEKTKEIKNPYKRMTDILNRPITKGDITELMLDDILNLKSSVKKNNENGIELYSNNIQNYSKILDYDPTMMLEGIIKKK